MAFMKTFVLCFSILFHENIYFLWLSWAVQKKFKIIHLFFVLSKTVILLLWLSFYSELPALGVCLIYLLITEGTS